MPDWAVRFLVRGEEGNRLADGRSRTLVSPDATDQRTDDGTDVSLRNSGLMLEKPSMMRANDSRMRRNCSPKIWS
jgi:hypothetical protein